MKVVHLNTNDSLGGAAIAAKRLHLMMLKKGYDSTMVVVEKFSDNNLIKGVSDIDRYLKWPFLRVIDNYFLPKRSDLKGSYSTFRFSIGNSLLKKIGDADIIYLHWVNNSFLNYKTLKKILALNKPVYWYMHDMFPITGGCHHSFLCNKYETECECCPYFKNLKKNDFSRKQFQKKKKLYIKYKDNLSFVAPSKWLYNCAKSSALLKENKVYNIPNLIDTEVYRPIDSMFAKKLWGITSSHVVLFGADNALTNPYKGFNYFTEALQILNKNLPQEIKDDVQVVVFGSSFNVDIEKLIPFKTFFAGKLHDDISIISLYCASDVFVISSIAENYPNTVLEALTCGTPVVGFDVGGVKDLIESDKNSYLAKYKDSEDLSKGIFELLINKKRSERTIQNDARLIKMHEQMWGENGKA